MSELNLMVTISDRNQIRRFLAFYKEYSVNIILVSMGRGTAEDDVLHSFGFEASEKAVLFAMVTTKEWKAIKSGLEKQIKIDIIIIKRITIFFFSTFIILLLLQFWDYVQNI